jgi:hypothetical protein
LKIIDEIPNPEIKRIVTEIINELGKRICDGENPSYELFENVSREILYKNKKYGDGYIHPRYARQIINKLPNWKNFSNLFDKKFQNGSNSIVREFRRKR